MSTSFTFTAMKRTTNMIIFPIILQHQLVNEITNNGLTLVKDPYGNYVVQYVLDLNYPRMTANLIAQFMGHLPELSTQKFSSNVVEKVCMGPAVPFPLVLTSFVSPVP